MPIAATQAVSHSPPNDRSLSNHARSCSSGASESKLDTGTSGVTSSLPEWLTGSSRNRLPSDDSHGNSWCFRRAANLLRESLDLSNDGGVIFLEANNSPFMDSESGSNASASDASGPATVLSMSTNDEPFSPWAGSLTTSPAARLDRSFLQLVLRRYPRGKLWSLHRDGLVTTSDDDDQEPRDKSCPVHSNHSPHGVPPIKVSKPIGKRRKAAENSILNRYFPGATQIMFVPLWNAVNSQWFAGCFCWTTVETQVFTTAVELSSVLGFGSSIMAEYSRVESLSADRQKGDFIGSISHELRSPLHGILGAAEFLSGTHLNEFQDSLLETVNACGRTLLDTMNQVLDFSKVVSLERTWRSLKWKKESPLDFKGTDNLASHLDTYVMTDLAILAEEVVEGICLGHAYGQNSTASADLPVLSAHNSPKPPATRSNVEVVLRFIMLASSFAWVRDYFIVTSSTYSSQKILVLLVLLSVFFVPSTKSCHSHVFEAHIRYARFWHIASLRARQLDILKQRPGAFVLWLLLDIQHECRSGRPLVLSVLRHDMVKLPLRGTLYVHEME